MWFLFSYHCEIYIGQFRIECASDGTNFECDKTKWDGELECSNILIWSDSAIGYDQPRVAETIAVSQGLYDGWSMMAGIMTVTEKQVAHDRIYVRLYGPHRSMTVFYDNISIVPIPKTCQNLILNSDFETGDSRFWLPSDRRYIHAEISNVGADGSQYSLMIDRYTSNRMRQTVDTRCMIEY